MSHYHVQLFRSDGSIKCEATVWSEHRDQAESKLHLLLARESNLPLDKEWRTGEALVPLQLAEVRRASTGCDDPSYPRYRLMKCDRKEDKCRAKEAAGLAAAYAKPRRRRRSHTNMKAASYDHSLAQVEPLRYCTVCGSSLAKLESASVSPKGYLVCGDCAHPLTKQQREIASNMNKAPERMHHGSWYRMLAEAGHMDKRED